MTSPTIGIGGAVAELTQSRNASTSEALAIFRAQVTRFKQRLATISGGGASRFALIIVAAVFGALLVTSAESRWMRDIPPMYMLGFFVIFAALALRVWLHYYYKRCAELYRECLKANRRFRIEENAVIATDASGLVSSIPWSAISDIVADKDSLMIYLSSVEAFFLSKAACENQDVEGFCAELTRRWQANRNASQPEAAS